jgi:hypothetical protein
VNASNRLALQEFVTEAELADWLTENVGPKIVNDYATATALLAAYDLAEKDGRGLNNQHQIAAVLAPTPAITSEPFTPYVPLAAEAAAQHLLETFRVTRKPANYERLLIDLPMPVVVSRHQCPFCKRFTRADVRQVQDHMTRCWQNPALKTCKTCIHHQPESRDAGHSCIPGQTCGCNDWDEACTHPDGPEFEDYRFPVLHCPLWEQQ